MAKKKRATKAQRIINRLRGKKEYEVKGAIPMKPKAKKLARTGKCSPGKTLHRGKCVPMIEGPTPAKKYSREWFTGKKKKAKKRKAGTTIEP